MRTSTRLASLVSVLALCLTACGDTGQQPGSGSTQVTPTNPQTPGPFAGIVDNTAISNDCRKVDCWQPTQFDPQLIELEASRSKSKRHLTARRLVLDGLTTATLLMSYVSPRAKPTKTT